MRSAACALFLPELPCLGVDFGLEENVSCSVAGVAAVVLLRLRREGYGRECNHAWHQQQVSAGGYPIGSGGSLCTRICILNLYLYL